MEINPKYTHAPKKKRGGGGGGGGGFWFFLNGKGKKIKYIKKVFFYLYLSFMSTSSKPNYLTPFFYPPTRI
jgi:hypothetical protein